MHRTAGHEMKRTVRELLSLEALVHLKYLPSMVAGVKNWVVFLRNYLGFANSAGIYVLRNGTKIKTNDTVDSATIAVVFLKKDYGTVQDHSLVVDIGANIGAYSLFSATTAADTMVYALEPMPETYRLFLENIRLNNLEKKIIPFNAAIAGKSGRRKLFIKQGSPFNSLYSGAGEGTSIEINCISLRDLFDQNNIKRCDMLKIDCEGAEYELLYATPKEYLDRVREIRMEYHDAPSGSGYTIDGLVSFLRQRGYQVKRLKKTGEQSGIAWFERVP